MRSASGLLAAGALLTAGCVGGPDLARGKAELEAGDTQAAEADLRPLAEMGYDDAKMQLARVYAHSDDPQVQQQAIGLYRELLKNDPTVAVPLAKVLIDEGHGAALDQAEEMLLKAEADGDERALVPLLSLYSDNPERDRKNRAPKLAEKVAKMKTADAETAIIKWYRRNALTDEKYQKELVKRCEDAKDHIPECYVDLARSYRANGKDKPLQELAAAADKRFTLSGLPVEVLQRLAWSLVEDDLPGKPQPELAHPILKRAAETNDIAAVRLARLYIEYPYIEPDANPEKLLLRAAGNGNLEACLALGRMYLDGKLVPADPGKAKGYFERAAASQPAAHYYLGRIYKRGYLGNSDPILAAKHYLTAARAGYPRADQALAQLFSDNRGVRPNLPNAYVFASIAAEAKTAEGEQMLKQIRALMKPDELQLADRLLKQELAVRAAQPAPAGQSATAVSRNESQREEANP